jgi:hypothetical protein
MPLPLFYIPFAVAVYSTRMRKNPGSTDDRTQNGVL